MSLSAADFEFRSGTLHANFGADGVLMDATFQANVCPKAPPGLAPELVSLLQRSQQSVNVQISSSSTLFAPKIAALIEAALAEAAKRALPPVAAPRASTGFEL